MSRVNEMSLTAQQMGWAVEHWLNTIVLKDTVKVTNVTKDSQGGGFAVKLTDPDGKEEFLGPEGGE